MEHISCPGGEDVEVYSWVSGPAERQSELQQLRSFHRSVIL